MGALKGTGTSISTAYKASPLAAYTGSKGGAGGTGFDAPQQADIQQGTSLGDVQGAQARAGGALDSQNALLSALQSQNGFQQQNNVSAQQQALANQLAGAGGVANQSGAMNQQQALNNQLAGANGINTQNQAIQGLQGTAGMYQNIANGTGPNPAQAALNQATGQNVANQAALMAGQRGAGANVGLLARQAAQQGANTQQQAVGQGATMQAQQQLNALSGLAGTQQAIGGLGTTQAGMQQAGIGAQGSLAAQQIAQQQAQQQALANQANTVAGQQIAATSANTGAALNNQGQLQGALQGINSNTVASQGNVNAANAGLANTQLGGQKDLIGGLLNAAGGGAGMAGGAKGAAGGDVVKMADGGIMAPAPVIADTPIIPAVPTIGAELPPPTGPQSSFGQFLAGAGQGLQSEDKPSALKTGAAKFGGKAGAGASGLANALMAKGGLAKGGGPVRADGSGQKAVKSGNSYDNDKIPAKLSEGEIVLPRSVTMSSDPVRSSADFVRKVIAKRGAR